MILNISKKFCPNSKAGQIWIETVIYTLIAFVMIGLVLSYVKPKIEESRDKAIIEQSINLVKDIDSTILTMGGAGNQRTVELGIEKGFLEINGEEDILKFEMESSYVFSEPGKEIADGNLVIITEEVGSSNEVTITRDYSDNYNLRYINEDESKTISKSSISYKLLISNKGEDDSGKIIINFEVN